MSGRCVISIGVFDGVHLGHQAIVRKGRAMADERGLPLRVLTFDPHPSAVLRPGTQPPRLATLDERTALLKQAGAHEVVVLQPTADLLAHEPESFVSWLIGEHRPAAVVEGHDFRFGRDRAGDMETLRNLGASHGFDVVEVETAAAVLADMLVVPARSSHVRWLIGCGRVDDAARCLGRLYGLSGKVVTGEKRGRTIGVPTANLDAAAIGSVMVPADGVYACLVDAGGRRDIPAAVSIGTKPTFGGASVVIEAHLLDFDEDLYEKVITIRFARWLRDQQSFPGLPALRAQLGKDIARTRTWHARGELAAPPQRRPALSEV